MSIYRQTLPEAFPYSIVVHRDEAEKIAAYLLEKQSSFAVTQDKPITIWLSEASMEHLYRKEAPINIMRPAKIEG